jgi:pyruvate,orthophosphate dikinase
VILVRIETSPEDLAGMNSAEGILTARGGMTSHAAVVARGMGKCCVSGAGGVKIDYKARTIEMEGKVYKEGDFISLNGSTGEVYDGQIKTVDPELSGDFGKLMKLADKKAKIDEKKEDRVAGNFGIGFLDLQHACHRRGLADTR